MKQWEDETLVGVVASFFFVSKYQTRSVHLFLDKRERETKRMMRTTDQVQSQMMDNGWHVPTNQQLVMKGRKKKETETLFLLLYLLSDTFVSSLFSPVQSCKTMANTRPSVLQMVNLLLLLLLTLVRCRQRMTLINWTDNDTTHDYRDDCLPPSTHTHTYIHMNLSIQTDKMNSLVY